MNFFVQQVEVRTFYRIHRETYERSIVTVSNRNHLSQAEHLRLLNLNDDDYYYEECRQ